MHHPMLRDRQVAQIGVAIDQCDPEFAVSAVVAAVVHKVSHVIVRLGILVEKSLQLGGAVHLHQTIARLGVHRPDGERHWHLARLLAA